MSNVSELRAWEPMRGSGIQTDSNFFISPLQSGNTAALLQHLAHAGHLLLGEPEGGDG